MISVLCESFRCLPTRVLWELENDPDQMVVQILQLRGFAAAKREYDRADDSDKLQKAIAENPMVADVRDMDHELAAEKVDALRRRAIADAMAEDI